MFAPVSGVYPRRRTSRILSPSFVWAKPISSVPRARHRRVGRGQRAAVDAERATSPTGLLTDLDRAGRDQREKRALDQSGRASSFQP